MTSALNIRRLTQSGLEGFRVYLQGLREGAAAAPPSELLTDSAASQPVGENRRVEPHTFATRLDAARYLDAVLEDIEEDYIETDAALWSWLSLFYFDQVCPPDRSGRCKPGRDYRHILEPGYPNGHRHLLAGAYLVYTVYGWGEEISPLLLNTPLFVENKFTHELAGRQSLITNRGVMEAACRLYFDRKTRKPKRGAQFRKNAPGTLYRFIDVIQQLDLNYDLYSMTGDEIVGILPAEFDAWKAQP